MNKRKLNFFDLFVILLVLAVACIGYLLSRTASGGGVQTVEVTYIMEANSLDAGFSSLIQVGDTWKESTKNYKIGTVADVYTEPQRTLMSDWENGAFFYTELPDKERAVLTMTCKAKVTDMEILLDGDYVLRAGTTMVISGPGYKFSVTVLQVLREGLN